MSSDPPSETRDADETDVPTPLPETASAAGGPARGRTADVLRVGPLPVPVSLAALLLSLAVHASVLCVGLAVMRGGRDRPPSVAFAPGDGGSGGSFFVTGPSAAPALAPPGLAPPDTATPPARAPGAADARPEALTDEGDFREALGWHAPARPPRVVIAGGESDADPLIGVPGGPPIPTLNFARGGAVGGGPSDRPGHEGAAGAGGGVAASTEAGGPGGAGGDGAGGSPGSAAGLLGDGLPAPVYPPESRRRGEQGTVLVEVELDAGGTITAVRVVNDAGHPRLAAAAVDAVRMARFRPGLRDGRPVACTVRLPFRFRLKGR